MEKGANNDDKQSGTAPFTLTYRSALLFPDHTHPDVKGLQIHCDLIR
jgi:hypothetical protein